MKKTENNSYILAFYKSGIFLPFILFFIIIFINHVLFLKKNFISYNWRYFLALFGGLNHDLFLFSLISLILFILCEYLPKIGKIIKSLWIATLSRILRMLTMTNNLRFRNDEKVRIVTRSRILRMLTMTNNLRFRNDELVETKGCGNLYYIFKLFSLIILHILICLPLFDYLYFNATLERFNWVVLNFINYHSIMGYFGNMGGYFLLIVFFFIFLIISIYLSSQKRKLVERLVLKPLVAICIFTIFGCYFTNNITFPIETMKVDEVNIVFTGDFKVAEGKNRILKNLIYGSILGYLLNRQIQIKTNNYNPYTDKEKAFLENYGILPVENKSLPQQLSEKSINNIKQINASKFDKVIMIVLESFALEYIHAINLDIPVEASPFFDYLINNFPHSNNFYTSDFPSLQGFNAILSSKIPFNEQNHVNQNYNIASIFEKKYPNSTWFFRGSSRVYGNEEIVVKSVFGFSNLIGYEDLSKKHNELMGSFWGYDDKILYDEAFNTLKNIKNNNYFIVIKLLNQHQPISSYIKDSKKHPDSVKKHSSEIVKAIYDADKLLKDFIYKCEASCIIDENTLVVITADHYPPLGYGHTELVKSGNHFQLGKLPLIFYSKQKEVFNNLDSEKLCCQLDITPTLCYLLGLDIPEEQMGRNMLLKDFKPRSIGILNNEKVFFQSDKFSFSESLTNPATSTIAIKKWINNLSAR